MLSRQRQAPAHASHTETPACHVSVPDLPWGVPEAVLSRARGIARLYSDMGIPNDKFLIRLPATWASIAAAKELEEEGIPTHLILVYR